MKIELILYGISRDIIGGPTYSIEIKEGSTVKDVMDFLVSKFSDFSKLKSLMIAVNDEYASDEHIIKPGDEVVLIPPVSGG
ncbi:MoaD/ThiS family protein [Reichenbachiella sp. MALMAid0571]|uniref:MoaD/ThiS family protein n=1 Tax=Reichenbachiella sp. MALMAid0571 TaxID=3143939 RepID=UPI0032DE70CC